ncbi:MAG: hypothetical protein NTU73_05320 [Ignavibacteriae bacterium]|nr:hypothetical protein [Ignavibacteriota bacterium]
MIYTKEQKLELRRIDDAVVSIEEYSGDRILRFGVGHRASIELMGLCPEKTAMLAKFDAARVSYEGSLTTKNIAISKGSEDVVLVDAQIKMVGLRVSAIKRKIREIKDTRATLVFFDLVNVDYYSKGRQSEIVKRVNELKIKVATDPAYVTVLPFVESLKLELGSIFALKTDQFTTITKDKTDVQPLLQTLKEAFIYNKGVLSSLYCDDLTKIFIFFPVAILHEKIVREESYVKKNQAFIANPSDAIINLPQPKFISTNLIYIDNIGPEPIKVYTLIKISNVIPETGLTIPGNSRLLAEILDLGPKTAKNLMMAFPGDRTKVKVRLTIITRKKKKKT